MPHGITPIYTSTTHCHTLTPHPNTSTTSTPSEQPHLTPLHRVTSHHTPPHSAPQHLTHLHHAPHSTCLYLAPLCPIKLFCIGPPPSARGRRGGGGGERRSFSNGR
ncbi:hypothetical protein E2C01_027139 [Portunus trituberculatus]|uniref:Uncharacterized protein n=1 Tax=Portunus trituberculatus TaxID=210409 RepID=A0A5B7EKJ4_PORTR|nr:hypothetical protein [Portunus trituberculatus]